MQNDSRVGEPGEHSVSGAPQRAEVIARSAQRLAESLKSFTVAELDWDWGCNIGEDARRIMRAEYQRRGIVPGMRGDRKQRAADWKRVERALSVMGCTSYCAPDLPCTRCDGQAALERLKAVSIQSPSSPQASTYGAQGEEK